MEPTAPGFKVTDRCRMELRIDQADLLIETLKQLQIDGVVVNRAMTRREKNELAEIQMILFEARMKPICTF